jgi:cytochrome c556
MSDDEFLYRLRSRPSAAFASRLKAKLDRKNAGGIFPPRLTLVGLLMAGAAVALIVPAVQRWMHGNSVHITARQAVPLRPQVPSANPTNGGGPAIAVSSAGAHGPASPRAAETSNVVAPAPEPEAVLGSSSEKSSVVGGVPIRSADSSPAIGGGCDVCKDKDIIEYRQDVMKTLDEQSAALGQMASGVVPPDSMVTDMQTLALAASTALKAFEPKVFGGQAKPDVWSNWDDFSKRMTDLIQRANAGAEAAKVQGSETASAALVDIANGCTSCHHTYRQESQQIH